ncbi:MAG: hypothetical protein J4428_01500 [Candidatus Aenigmarchaeota archaeon]|nr:hypothetical protein [Candidatus Aenigmarchaeota archaeon]
MVNNYNRASPKDLLVIFHDRLDKCQIYFYPISDRNGTIIVYQIYMLIGKEPYICDFGPENYSEARRIFENMESELKPEEVSGDSV